VWSIPIVGVLAVVLGGIRTGYTPKSVLLWGIAGMAIGGLLVPDIEPKSVRFPALWQMACGVLAGILMAIVLGSGVAGIAAGATIGLALGFLAPYWLKYFDF
jgi:hypothetical protein